jgi:hypothetical protein
VYLLIEGDGDICGFIGVEQAGELVIDVPDAHPEPDRSLGVGRVGPEKTGKERTRPLAKQGQRGDEPLLPMRNLLPSAIPAQCPTVEQVQGPLGIW